MSKRPSLDSVIDLTLDDDKEESRGSSETSRLGGIRRKLEITRRGSKKKAKTSGGAKEDDCDDDDGSVVIVKTERTGKTSITSNFDEEVEIVQAPPPAMESASEMMAPIGNNNSSNSKPNGGGEDDDDDIVMCGRKNFHDLPHMRPHCVTFKFQFNPNDSNNDDNNNNKNHCDLCYCYVCDCPVKDCTNWDFHCNASDKEAHWVRRRHGQASGTNNPQPSLPAVAAAGENDFAANLENFLNRTINRMITGNVARRRNTITLRHNNSAARRGRQQQRLSLPPSTPVPGAGPFEPNDPIAASNKTLMNCSKCNWFSRRGSSYCQKCGRVGWATAPSQSVPYKAQPHSVLLGTRTISFRILSRDVREMPKYKDSWAAHSVAATAAGAGGNQTNSWTYDESEMEEDLFKQRLGTQPTIASIMKLVSIYGEEKLKESAKDPTVQERGLEAILLDDHNDLTLLRVLAQVDTFGKKLQVIQRTGQEIPNNQDITGDITARWDKDKKTGVFEIRVFLPERCFSQSSAYSDPKYTFLLGAWFNIFPFNLLDLSGPLKAHNCHFPYYNPVEPGISADGHAAAKKRMETAVQEHNEQADVFDSQLTLISSTGHNHLGGITGNKTTIESVLQQYFRESFGRECARDYGRHSDWERMEEGIVSNYGLGVTSQRSNTMDMILNNQDSALARSCMSREAQKVKSRLSKGVTGIMEVLENLGHESEVDCEGLTCELLPFQKQSLRWALEREMVEGGIQRFFWVPIPVQIGSTKQDVYYCPIIQRFRRDKPKVVRGGIIAEEMGLGKTVISLALILKNPAPELPVSGSPTTALSTSPKAPPDRSKWDQEIIQQDESELGPSSLRGSIISRGTLVICPVSLVGQWIEEAKSKLKNPGLVYPYHGQNRKRDANILAKNEIVVTTYDVLRSDDTYHRKKSADPISYVPPVEQIRWWRIIFDEGHFLREANTSRNRSISNLVAQNRWLVSGTPINTSIRDLKNQMSILGIENVEALFRVFSGAGVSSRRRLGRFSSNADAASPEDLMFFLRSLLIHHKQKQQYRGTDTTLMSLPEKTERLIEVHMSTEEKTQYDALELDAKSFYITFKASHTHDLSKYYLSLSQKLTPMRVACSGGYFPLSDQDAGDDGDNNDEGLEDEDDEGAKPKGRKKEAVIYSDFAFTCKFKVLLSELERIRDEDPSSKSLVFSQYASTLNWLKEELPKHGFSFRTLSGSMTMPQRAKALHDFQQDPPTTIFLLSMRSGNCGINLTQANMVFIMEPGFNPALEKQAIGRVFRLGQKRKVEIVRLIVKDSIETRIRAFLEHKYGTSSAQSGEEVAVGPIGNQASEKPKAKIVAKEFDILFGVDGDKKPSAKAKRENSDTKDHCMPDAAPSSDFF